MSEKLKKGRINMTEDEREEVRYGKADFRAMIRSCNRKLSGVAEYKANAKRLSLGEISDEEIYLMGFCSGWKAGKRYVAGLIERHVRDRNAAKRKEGLNANKESAR